MPVTWRPASPMLGEREVADGLLAHAARGGALRPGLILIGTRVRRPGLRGPGDSEFKMALVRTNHRDEAPRLGSIGLIRKRIGQ